MRVLIVIPYFYPAEAFGGPVKGTFLVGKELVKRGHEVVVYTSDARDLEHRLGLEYDKVEGMSVHYLRNLSMFPVKWSKLFITPDLHWKLKSDLKSFDVVHTHEYTTYQNIVVHRFAKKFKVPYVFQAHGSLPKIGRQARKWFYNASFGSRFLRDVSKAVALSRAEVQQYKGMGVPDARIAIVPNGIDLAEYKDLPRKGCFRRKFSIREDAKVILFLGRINNIKGIDFLVKAYAHLLEKSELDNLLLVIAGSDDGYLSELKQLLDSSMISNDVLFTGPLYGRDKLEAYMDADVFVLPSRYETFPNVVLEAYACSTPVIASNVESIPDLVIRGKTGLLFSAGNVQELAEMISFMLTHPEKAEEMSQRGRKFVEDEFSIDKVADSLEILYEKIQEEKQAG